jgi:hypothetical protein
VYLAQLDTVDIDTLKRSLKLSSILQSLFETIGSWTLTPRVCSSNPSRMPRHCPGSNLKPNQDEVRRCAFVPSLVTHQKPPGCTVRDHSFTQSVFLDVEDRVKDARARHVQTGTRAYKFQKTCMATIKPHSITRCNGGIIDL